MPIPLPPIVALEDTVLALDPGKFTGLALIQPHVSTHVLSSELDVDAVVSAFQKIRDHVGHQHLEVVMEAFTISERTIKTALSLDALDLIGYVKLSCTTAGIPFKLQLPAQAKSFATDSKLKAIGWYDRTPDGHKNDALRHLLVYMINTYSDWSSEHIIPALAKELLV